MSIDSSSRVFIGVKDGLVNPNVIMNSGTAINVKSSKEIDIDGNYFGGRLSDDDCSSKSHIQNTNVPG